MTSKMKLTFTWIILGTFLAGLLLFLFILSKNNSKYSRKAEKIINLRETK